MTGFAGSEGDIAVHRSGSAVVLCGQSPRKGKPVRHRVLLAVGAVVLGAAAAAPAAAIGNDDDHPPKTTSTTVTTTTSTLPDVPLETAEPVAPTLEPFDCADTLDYAAMLEIPYVLGVVYSAFGTVLEPGEFAVRPDALVVIAEPAEGFEFLSGENVEYHFVVEPVDACVAPGEPAPAVPVVATPRFMG